ncbi:MAG: aminotransferase class I/II-fold pyridoxal phosphate-dependent enzyme [Deltaproteobacteria bacterium]|jgi:cystathionine beta-lyase/cystathionine gamma-synthase|nr:aminotransferase class I/II-fold pyridoxal phosphate-dependent enzyme [Deltaproteobacteria bacterium]
MKLDTLLAQAGSRRDAHTGAIAVPIITSSAFQHPALGQSTGFDYSRTSNPTRLAFEQTMAALDGGAGAAAFASGLAAIDALIRLFKPGDKLVVTEDLYGGTIRLFEKFGHLAGLDFIYVDSSDTAAVDKALQTPGVKGLFVEIPTNPLLKVANLNELGALSKKYQVLFIVDNTFLTPVLCRPLEHGADISVYSATKYLGGHHDLIAGVAVARTKELAERLTYIQNVAGAILGPFESWLLLRSLKTLNLRMKKHGENALTVARFLQNHPGVKNLHYPGLSSEAGYKTMLEQAQGFGGMISFEVESPEKVKSVLATVKVFLFAESLGGAESLVTFPVKQTHADLAPEIQAKLGLTDCLLRLSIGLEDAEDLVQDLASALA